LVVFGRYVRLWRKGLLPARAGRLLGPVSRAVRTVHGRTPRTPGARPGPSTGPVRRSGPGLVAKPRDRSHTTQARTINPEPDGQAQVEGPYVRAHVSFAPWAPTLENKCVFENYDLRLASLQRAPLRRRYAELLLSPN